VLRDALGASIRQYTTPAPYFTIRGLANGSSYTAEIRSRNPLGVGSSAAVSFVPVVAPIGLSAEALLPAVSQFVDVRARLRFGSMTTASAALAGRSAASQISALVSSYAPRLVASWGVVATQSGHPPFASAATASDLLAIPDSTGVTVRATVTTTVPDENNQPGASPEITEETLRFVMSSGGPTLTSVGSQVADDLLPSVGSPTSATVDDTGSGGGQSIAPAVAFDANGWPVNDSNVAATRFFTAASSLRPADIATSISDQQRAADLAWSETNNNIWWGCTPFISHILHDGMGVNMRWTFSARGLPATTNPRGWFKGTWKSHSWSVADTLARFLRFHSVYVFTDWSKARAGDLVFYDENMRDHPNVISHFDHVGIVYQRDHWGLVWVAQKNAGPHEHTTLQDQWQRRWSLPRNPSANGVNMVLYRIGFK